MIWDLIGPGPGQRVALSLRYGELAHVLLPHDGRARFERLRDLEEVRLGLVPRRGRSGLLTYGNVAWVRLETARSCKALERFLTPTLVIREGKTQRRLAVWALARPLDPFGLEDLNKRLARRLGCAQKHGEPDRSWLVPGTRVLQGKGSWLRVWAEFESDAVYDADGLLARAPALPDRNAWRDAA